MTSTPQINMTVLKLGSQGSAVKNLQQLIVQYFGGLDYEEDRIQVDGIFGSATESAVKEVQERFFLVADGIVGSKTWKILMTRQNDELPVLRRGSQGELVRRVQERLAIHKYAVGAIDGVFGPKTEAAVKALQSRGFRAVVDGVIGERTWGAIHSLYPYRIS